MSTTSRALAVLTQAIVDLTRQQAQIRSALVDCAREQQIANLLVRAQISTSSDEKDQLVAEAARLMEGPRWRPAPDPVWTASDSSTTSPRP